MNVDIQDIQATVDREASFVERLDDPDQWRDCGPEVPG